MMNDPIRQDLHELPEAEPSGALWKRIADARQRQARRQRGLIAGGTVACTALAATLFFNVEGRFADAGPAMTATPGPTAPTTVTPPPESLYRIDRELQLAYARHADDAELASLWAVRQDILRSRTDTVQPLGI